MVFDTGMDDYDSDYLDFDSLAWMTIWIALIIVLLRLDPPISLLAIVTYFRLYKVYKDYI